MTQDTPDLTDRQKEFIACLPASAQELQRRMNVKNTTLEGYRDRLDAKGIELDYDTDAQQWYIADDRAPKLRRISSKHKSTKTREANELIEESETRLLRRLRQNDPLDAPPSGSGAATLVAALGDLHFGDLVENERGDVIYNCDIAKQCVQTFGQKTLRIAEDAYESFDDIHLVLLGDLATGMGIYEGQVHDVEAHLTDQVTYAVQSLFQLIETFAEHFDTVQISCVMGNHGEIRASGVSKQANCDLLVYRWLDDALRRSGIDNVSMDVAEATHHLNTQVRDWNLHVRHGQDGKQHVDDTSSSQSEWRGWRDAHRYHFAIRGHWHDPAIEHVLNRYPVVTVPSPKPGSEYIERMGSPDVKTKKNLGYLIGVDDDRPIAFSRLVDNV